MCNSIFYIYIFTKTPSISWSLQAWIIFEAFFNPQYQRRPVTPDSPGPDIQLWLLAIWIEGFGRIGKSFHCLSLVLFILGLFPSFLWQTVFQINTQKFLWVMNPLVWLASGVVWDAKQGGLQYLFDVSRRVKQTGGIHGGKWPSEGSWNAKWCARSQKRWKQAMIPWAE